MATPRTGRPRGRPPKSKNKATLEREHKAIEVLQAKSLVPLRALAKDQLAELVPVVKGMVAQFQRAAMDSGLPGTDKWRPDLWKELRDWIKTYAAVADLAADFQSPRFRAIAMVDGRPDERAPFVVRVPAVMSDSTIWQAAVGSEVLDMEAAQASQRAAVARQNEVAATIPAQTVQNAPATAPAPLPVVLTVDPNNSRITAMPPGPATVKPVGTQEWLDSVAAERRKAAG
jgi:hypothetical protein